jgi:phosphodiesterase/alkaline phosphatase D-like protein
MSNLTINYKLSNVTYGPVVKGTEDPRHIRLWCRIKNNKKNNKKNKVQICVVTRLKVLGESTYLFADYRYTVAVREYKYITLLDYLDLQPNSVYEYQMGYLVIKTKNLHGEYFDNPENIMTNFDWTHASYGTFKTGNGDYTSFVFGSCRKWIKVFGKEVFGLGKSADQVYDAIRSHSPDFFLSVGDQIYLDPVGKNLLQCRSFKSMVERYDKVRNYNNIKRLMANTCTYEICDDHDHLCNDSNYDRRKKYKKIYKNSIRAYFYYQSIGGPMSHNKENHKPLYYTFERDHACFFVMDTRDERDERSELSKKIISKKQMDAIQEWLFANVNDNRVMFLVSPTPILSVTSRDSWFGYPKQQAKLIDMIVAAKNKNFFILTGDVHCCRVGVYEVYLDNNNVSPSDYLLTEIASSGLASLTNSHGKECNAHSKETMIDFNVEEYSHHNDFPYELDNTAHGGVKLVTYYAKNSFPQRNDQISKGVFTKITIKDRMVVETFNQNNNLLDTCIFNLSV